MNAITPARAAKGHQSARAQSDTWLTPPDILKALGPFDLDPCACPLPRPWSTAEVMWTKEDGPLDRAWSHTGHRLVWLNPPFGPRPLVRAFVDRMAMHGHGVALLPATTETALWQNLVWPSATAVLFLAGRPHFHHQDGTRAAANSGQAIALVAYGWGGADRLIACDLPGKLVMLHER